MRLNGTSINYLFVRVQGGLILRTAVYKGKVYMRIAKIDPTPTSDEKTINRDTLKTVH